jgi:protein-disulfide isomerase
VIDMMGDARVTALITANHDIAQAWNISGTPTFLVGDVLLRGYLPQEDMQRIVAEARAG